VDERGHFGKGVTGLTATIGRGGFIWFAAGSFSGENLKLNGLQRAPFAQRSVQVSDVPNIGPPHHAVFALAVPDAGLFGFLLAHFHIREIRC
jgi:hypothetical protein